VFESIPEDDGAARLRAAMAPPLGAFLLALVYLTVYPLFSRVPPLVFWILCAVLVAGSVLGAAGILREVRRERIRGRAIAWLVAATGIELLCTWITLGLLIPWL
jgi:uncharacterized membrane protein YecN with MAPEG domain